MTRHCSVVFRIYKLALLFITIAVTPSVSIAAHARQMHALSPATQAAAATQSFDEYWEPIEAGIGSIPQSYLTLTAADRRSVRDEVKARLAPFETDGKLCMSVEMLIGRGRA